MIATLICRYPLFYWILRKSANASLELIVLCKCITCSRREDGKYITKVTERDMIVIRVVVKNNKERAFLAKLFIEYDQNELDEPQQLSHKSIDIERKENGLAVLALGNPLEEENEVNELWNFNILYSKIGQIIA